MLGILLGDLLANPHIDGNLLCHGLCSPAMLKKYITGQKKPEKLLGDALWQRAGKSMEKFEIFLEQDEYILAKERTKIQLLIRHGALSEAENAIQKYQTLKGGNSQLHIQFLCLQRAEIYRRNRESYQRQMKNLRSGMAQTLPDHILTTGTLHPHLLGTLELLLISRYAFLLEEQKPEKAALWYERLISYLTEPADSGISRDLANKRRLLPPLYYHQALRFTAIENKGAALCALNQGIKLLQELQGFEGMFIRMMELKIKLLQNSPNPVPQQEISCLEVLSQEMAEYHAANLDNIYPDYPERNIFNVNNMLRERRIAYKITEENMADQMDCDLRTLKDIEKGKRMPQSRTKIKFFQIFNLSTWKYCGTVSTRTYSFYRKCTEIIKYNYERDHKKAWEIYQEIAKTLKTEDRINQQFLKYWNTVLSYSSGKTQKNQYRTDLLGILLETLPNQSIASGQCSLTRYERKILEDLAWDMDAKDSDGIGDMLYTQYSKFKEDESLGCLFPEYYMSLAYCCARFAMLKHDFEESERILEDALRQIRFLQNDFRLDCLHIQRFLLEINKLKAQGQLPASNNRKNFRWIRYAYAISKLYRPDTIITTNIEKYLIKYWKDTKEILNCL